MGSGTTFQRRIALLHLAPTLGDLEANRALLQEAVVRAADAGAEWVVTPELPTSGYEFQTLIGTGWIEQQPGAWMQQIADLVATRRICLFLHHPERDASGALFSSMWALDRDGSVLGTHRKFRPIAGAEDWASPSDVLPSPVSIDGVAVGMLICADAYPAQPARHLAQSGAQIVLSSAAWHPGQWGPAGEWEARSAETGLAIVVCNRTGQDLRASFEAAQSVVTWRGRRVVEESASRSAVFVVSLEFGTRCTIHGLERIDL